MNLELSASSMLEQYPDGRTDLQRQEHSLEAFGTLAVGGLVVIVGLAICGFIYLIVTRMILPGTQPIAGALLALFLVFAGLSLAYVFRNEALKDKRRKMTLAPGLGNQLPADTKELLAASVRDPLPSVTEDTTRLLKIKDHVPRQG
jgi:ABC-type transport system involved in cytochrome bd biosynthesis fused ATPase/permease subunit